MSIKNITPDDLRQMQDREALILQGCGGEPQEWLDGINDLFTNEGILLNGTRFQNCSVFEHNNLTCIMFPFEGVELNIGKLAMWRIQTRSNYGGTWLSDYVPNRLGGFVQTALQKFEAQVNAIKSDVRITDSNTWALFGEMIAGFLKGFGK